MTLIVSAVVQPLLHLTDSDPHLHETTLSIDMSYEGAGRYSQNEFMNEISFPPPLPLIHLFPL